MQAPSRDLPAVLQEVSSYGVSDRSATLLTSRLIKLAGTAIVTGALVLVPTSFAQRGGGSSGGGGSAGGGAHSGGGASFGGGGGGSHSSGGGHASGTGSRSAGAGGHSTSSTSAERASNASHESGLGAAIRRFFGFSAASKSRVTQPVHGASSAGASNALLGNRASLEGNLPPAFGRVQLTRTPLAFGDLNSAAPREQAALQSPKPAVSAPPRPIWPRPPRFYPYYPGCYGGCGLGLGFGFGFPLLYFGYWDSTPSYQQYPTRTAAVMLVYLNDGSALELVDYWIDGDTMHYVTESGTESAVSVSDLDLQRTIDANARVGLKFTLDRRQRGQPFEKMSQQSDPPSQPRPQHG